MVRRVRELGAAVLAAAVVVGLPAPAALAGPAKVKASAVRAFPGHIDPTSLACPPGVAVAEATCYALDSDTGMLAPIVKGTPHADSIPATGGTAVACASSTTCAVSGVSGTTGTLEWIVNGKATKTVTVTGSSYLYGVACETATTCLVVGERYGKSSGTSSGVFAVVNESASSATATKVKGAAVLEGITCPTSNVCLAVGTTKNSTNGLGIVVRIVGGKVGAKKTAAGTDALAAISCGSAATCWATGTTSSPSKGITIVVEHIKQHIPVGAVAGPKYGEAIACVSASVCLFGTATGTYGTGQVDVLKNGKVVQTLTLSGFKYGVVSAFSCPTSSSCMAAAATGFHNPGPGYYYTGGVATVST